MKMSEGARRFIAKLDQEELEYSTRETETKFIVVISYNGDNMDSIRMQCVFDGDDDNVAIRVFTIAKVPQAKMEAVALACSNLNNQYRWLKFYIDNDGDIDAEVDGVITVQSAADVTFELMQRTHRIVDKAYPDLMSAVWKN